MPLISVIIITKNEAHNIEACLQSVAWADEIVVVDSGSTDSTVEIARKYTDKILMTDWPGYGPQKQRALAMATGEWILSIDADERVSPELQKEMCAAILNTKYDGFEISFQSEYCGKIIRFGDWWHDRQAVLFRRTKGRFSEALVHETIDIQGSIGRLKGTIYHIAFPNLTTVLRKMNDYSSWSAEQKSAQGKKGGVLRAIGHGLFAFIRSYIIRLGFLDGREGFFLAVSNAEGTYYRYLKLMYLLEQSDHATRKATKKV